MPSAKDCANDEHHFPEPLPSMAIPFVTMAVCLVLSACEDNDHLETLRVLQEFQQLFGAPSSMDDISVLRCIRFQADREIYVRPDIAFRSAHRFQSKQSKRYT